MASPEPILFPDAEQLLIDYLDPLIAVPVGTRVPNPRPASFVRVLRTGGPRGSVLVLDTPQITVETWAATETAAAQLAQLVRAHLSALPGRVVGGVMVYRTEEFSGPANLPDPASAQARYTMSISVLLRGTVL